MSGRGHQRETEREVRGRRKREQEEWAMHGGYMQAKIRKLINKYDSDKIHEESQSYDDQSNIFSNVAVFVNGYTEPSFDVLRQLMIENGGKYEHYYSATRVTHIIATSLALSKQKLFQNKKVVLPSWITESVEKKQQQPYEKYLLLADTRITQYFTPQSHTSSTEGEGGSVADQTSDLSTEEDSNRRQPTNIAGPSTRKEETGSNAVASAAPRVISPPSMLAADQPGFVSEFYENSRLHHISHWRTHLKDLVNEIRADPNHKLSGREKLLRNCSNVVDRSLELSALSRITPTDKVYMHLDMDCFFVSVVLRSHPELKDMPVAVAHSKGNNPSTSTSLGSMSQIASCNYPARQAGVRNGMMMGKALTLCSQLQVLPYDFDGYSQVSTLLYQTVASYTTEIEAVSCDELYIDITSLMNILPYNEFAQLLRDDIQTKTGCPCSAGGGGSLLLARVATKKAKPNGQFYVSEDEVENFMAHQPVGDLPGVGRATGRLLGQLRVSTCADLQTFPLARLKKEFGAKTGDNLYRLCRGKDDRVLRADQPRQSVSCDVNYGIRLTELSQVEVLLKNISIQVASKLDNAQLLGRQVTLKVKLRSPDAPVESAKFMGHGICDSLTKSSNLASPTRDPILIYTVCLNIWKGWRAKPSDLRGVGIQLTKLDKARTDKSTAQTDISTFTKKGMSRDSDRNVEERRALTDSCTVPTVVPEVPSLCQYRDCEVDMLLERWFRERPDGPCEKDKGFFSQYLTRLVQSDHLDTAWQVYLTINRLREKIRSSAWNGFCDEVKHLLKTDVMLKYKAHLDLSD